MLRQAKIRCPLKDLLAIVFWQNEANVPSPSKAKVALLMSWLKDGSPHSPDRRSAVATELAIVLPI
jgi:hypothetical protein